jgi:hypothetical protein
MTKRSERTDLDSALAWLVEFEALPIHELEAAASSRLAQSAKRAHRLAGATELIEGRAVFAAQPGRPFLQKAKRQRKVGAVIYAWTTKFGPVATLTLMLPGGDEHGRVCGWARDSVWDSLALANPAPYLLLCEDGAPVLLLKANPSDRRNFAALLERTRAGPVLGDEPAAAYWLFEQDSFKNEYTAQDRLRRGWAPTLSGNLQVYVKQLGRYREDNPALPQLPEGPEWVMLRELWQRLSDNYTSERADWLLSAARWFLDHGSYLDLHCDLVEANDIDPRIGAFRYLLMRIPHIACLLPEVTHQGERFPYWAGISPGVSFPQAKYRTVPAATLRDRVDVWWPRMSLDMIHHISEAYGELDPSAMPADYLEIVEGLKPVHVSNAEDCRTAARRLIEEGRACQQWTIPPGAVVELPFGPYERFQLWQFGDEIPIVGWNRTGEFAVGGFNLNSSAIRLPIPSVGADNEIDDAEAALTLLLASVIRDFLVVEERESVWTTKEKGRLPGIRPRPPFGKLITYISRRRYVQPLGAVPVERLNETLDLAHRAEHTVRAHLRRIDGEASKSAALLAARYGLPIKTGYTFVKPHVRGGLSQREHVYRSRSALATLYADEVIHGGGGTVEWFKFERDIRALMVTRGLEVEHLGANPNGDGGIDLYAWNPNTGSTFAVQAKCWSTPVGPDVVRQLSGSLNRYPSGTVGIIVTTSRFTTGAVKEAQVQEIELIDGVSFLKMVQAASLA